MFPTSLSGPSTVLFSTTCFAFLYTNSFPIATPENTLLP